MRSQSKNPSFSILPQKIIYKVSGEQIESISIGPAFTDITVPVSIYSGGVYLYTVKSADESIVSNGKFIVN